MEDSGGFFGVVDYTKCGKCGTPFTKEEIKNLEKSWDPNFFGLGMPLPCPDMNCEGHMVPICDTCATKKPKASPIIEAPEF